MMLDLEDAKGAENEFSFKESVWHCMFMYVEDTEKELETRNWKGVRVMWCACVLFADSSISEEIFQRTLIQVDQCAKWSVGRTPTDSMWTDSKCIRQFQFSAVASCKLIGKRLDNVVLLLQWCLIQYTYSYSVGWSAEAGNQFLQVPIIRVLAWALCRSGLKVGSKKHQCRRSSVVTYKSCSTILELKLIECICLCRFSLSTWNLQVFRLGILQQVFVGAGWCWETRAGRDDQGVDLIVFWSLTLPCWECWGVATCILHITTHYYRRTVELAPFSELFGSYRSAARNVKDAMVGDSTKAEQIRPLDLCRIDIFWHRHSVGLKAMAGYCSGWEPSTGVLILAVLPNVFENNIDKYW